MPARTTLTAVLWAALFAALLAAAVSGSRQRRSADPEGGSAALMRNLLRARELEIVVEERAAQEPLARAAFRLRERAPELLFDAVVRPTSSGAYVPRIVVGTSAAGFAGWLARTIGIGIAPGPRHTTFRYGERDFTEPGDGIIATFADPERPGLPITLVYANDVQTAVSLAGSLMPGFRPWVRVLRGGEVALEGPLERDGTPRPPDLARVGLERLVSHKTLRPLAGAPPEIRGLAAHDLPAQVVERYVRACVRAREVVLGWYPSGTALPPADVRLWSRADDYVANGDASSLSKLDRIDGSVDALLGIAPDGATRSGAVDDGGASVARAAAWKTLGPPVEPWMLDAAGVDAAWSWWGRDLDAWLAHLLRTGSPDHAVRALTVQELCDAQSHERISAHILSPQRGALWRFLRETRGQKLVRELWQGTRALDPDPALDAAFDAWLRARTSAISVQVEIARDSARAKALSPSLLRGAAMCEAAVEDHAAKRTGYGSRAFDAGVETARADGADALSVTAVGCDLPGLPALYDDDSLRFGSREGDVRLWAALERARASGMRTMLSPELLTTAGGTWSGKWDRGDTAHWTTFFERYARFVEHHALLAELSGATVLSLGTGIFSVAGLDADVRRPMPGEEGWKRAGWARVISAARNAFPGALVYSASGVDELEKVLFFPEIDLVGLALAPSLDDDDPWDGKDAMVEIGAQIDGALGALERVAARVDKPVMLTRVVFSPDLHGAARVLGAGTSSREWQARQFGILAGRLKGWGARSRLAGVFVWRWTAGDEETPAGEHDPVIATQQMRSAAWWLWTKM